MRFAIVLRSASNPSRVKRYACTIAVTSVDACTDISVASISAVFVSVNLPAKANSWELKSLLGNTVNRIKSWFTGSLLSLYLTT